MKARTRTFALSALLAALSFTDTAAAQASHGFSGLAAGAKPRVEIAWNRLYDYDEIHAHLDTLVAAYPQFLSMQVIGRSIEDREMRVYTLSNSATGAHDTKPAMWVDGNIHGNEVQGSEAVVYVAWYLMENYGHVPRVTQLVDDSTFYLCPMLNPDGRASWFRDAHNASSSRSGRQPIDDDGDGLYDEDGPDDLDGDGSITQMRKYTPGQGSMRLNPDDPRLLEPVPANDRGIRGDWTMLGSEGIDNDGDGRLNEDSVGGYDMNRAWPSGWQPEWVQGGAGPYPLYWPETRCIARFWIEHPNLAGVQSFHNAGGMILRGPGFEAFGDYPREDVAVYDELGRDGEAMLPYYRYMIIWKDLYSVFGGSVTYAYEGLGVISFTNELWNTEQMFGNRADANRGRAANHSFDDKLLMGAGFTEWRKFTHPLYGEIEIGGFKKDVGRVPPSFLIEEMTHRNALFAIRHAEALPKVAIAAPTVTELGGGLRAIDVEFRNEHVIPTRTARAMQKQIGRPDEFSIEGEGLEVLAGGFRTDRFRPERLDFAEREPATLRSERGIGGRAEVRVRWIVRGSGDATVRWRGEKARAASVSVRVE
jgi:hypothetical protein